MNPVRVINSSKCKKLVVILSASLGGHFPFTPKIPTILVRNQNETDHILVWSDQNI